MKPSVPVCSSSRTARSLLVLALLALTTSVVATARSSQDAATPAAKLPTAPMGSMTPEEEETFAVLAEELAFKVCNDCHALEEVTVVRRSPRNWRDMVTSMANKGAVATKDQFATVGQYLARYYGLVRVNVATADEFSAVLGLSPREAAAIVAHRTTNGRFTNLDALSKVPGIDKAKLEEQPEALSFE